MTCRETLDFLMAYLDGELPADVRGKFERHLSVCPPCVAYLESYRMTVALGQHACQHAEGELPPVPEELVRAILASGRQ